MAAVPRYAPPSSSSSTQAPCILSFGRHSPWLGIGARSQLTMSSPLSQGVDWFHPGELMIVARVANDATDPAQLHAAMDDLLRQRSDGLGMASGSLRSFVFGAPTEPTSLAFFFQKLETPMSVPR